MKRANFILMMRGSCPDTPEARHALKDLSHQALDGYSVHEYALFGDAGSISVASTIMQFESQDGGPTVTGMEMLERQKQVAAGRMAVDDAKRRQVLLQAVDDDIFGDVESTDDVPPNAGSAL